MQDPFAQPDTQHTSAKSPQWSAIWHWVIDPPATLTPSLHFQARMLTWLLLILLLSMVAIFPIILFTSSPENLTQPLIFIVTAVLLVSAYSLTRTRYYMAAAWLTILVTNVSVWVFAYLNRTNSPGPTLELIFTIIPVIVSGLLVSARATAVLAAINLTGLLLLPFLMPGSLVLESFPTLPIFVSLSCILTVVVTVIRQHDRDELQRRSLALAQSQERLELVSFATNDAVWDWDLVSGTIWRNQNVRRLLSYKPYRDNAGIDWWLAQIHPDDREKFRASIDKALASEEDFWSREYRLQHDQGGYAYIFDRAYITRNDTHTPTRMVGAMMDITERKRVELALRDLSVRDPLTGLFNRRYLEETLSRELSRAARHQRPVGVIMIDIDHFKHYNDTYGHAVGDDLLRELGGYLVRQVRGSDIACRYGGEEFTVVLPDASLEMTERRAEHLRQGTKQITIPHGEQTLEGVTLSIGVACYPAHGHNAAEILAAADAALYQAKTEGRDRVVVSTPSVIAGG